jgi:hypothetical protein
MPMEPLLGELFLAARGRLSGRVAYPASEINLLDIGCIHIDGHSFDDLKDIVETARKCSGWAVLMLHGIGPDTHSLFLDEMVHARFIAWLADQPFIWIAPVRTVAHYLKDRFNGL